MTTHPTLNSHAGPALRQEESARYALLRRIAPALRHHLAGALQPIGMVSAIMERRLQAETPDLAALRESNQSITTLSRAATSTSMDLVTWLAPRDHSFVTLHAGLEECMGMLATDLAFRGFTIVNEVAPSTQATSVLSLRTVATAALIALTDAAQAPARVLFSDVPADGTLGLSITLSSEDGAVPSDHATPYRQLGWDDVQALAAAEKVALHHDGNRAVMRFTAAEHTDTKV